MRQAKINNGIPKINGFDPDMKQVQNFNRAQIYAKGFLLGAQSGSNDFTNINLGGKARKLYGFALYVPVANDNDADTFTLNINQELTIERVPVWAYNPRVNTFKTQQFYELPRPLSGSDTIQLGYDSVGAHPVYIVFYIAQE